MADTLPGRLRNIIDMGIVNAVQDCATLRQAAEVMAYLPCAREDLLRMADKCMVTRVDRVVLQTVAEVIESKIESDTNLEG